MPKAICSWGCDVMAADVAPCIQTRLWTGHHEVRPRGRPDARLGPRVALHRGAVALGGFGALGAAHGSARRVCRRCNGLPRAVLAKVVTFETNAFPFGAILMTAAPPFK